jgi:hypothetical protein
MDVEVGYSIGKYLIKLKKLKACIYNTINVVNTGLTEEMVTMIAKRLPQLKDFIIHYSSNQGKLRLRRVLKPLFPNIHTTI